MSLIKKTIVLKNNSINGHITVVRIGASVGAKMILTENLEYGTLYLKIGHNPVSQHIVKGKRAEIALQNLRFEVNDEIGAIIVKDKKIFTQGGDCKGIKIDFKEDYNNNEEDFYYKESKENTFVAEEYEAKKSEPISERWKKPEMQDYDKEEKIKREKENIFDYVNPHYKETNFYIKQKNKFDEIFTIYPKNEELERYIDDSKWVTINYDGDDYYVVGLLKSNDTVTHIVYGVPGLSGIYPPNETLEISDWLPTPTRENSKRGYWLIFQDALSGEITKI